MNYLDKYKSWLNDKNFDEDFINELKNIPNEDIEEFFYKDLSFGTAGIRGINGAGSNRMSKYIIRKATQGYSNYLKSKNQNATCVIAYDNRKFSRFFAIESARVLTANGIKTYIYKELRPTPQLSYSVRELKTTGGIVLTASHNPPEYSGYKVYGEDGAQLSTQEALKVTNEIENQNGFNDIKIIDISDAENQNLLIWLDETMDNKYIDAVKESIIHKEAYAKPLTFLYTALNGTGAPIMKLLFENLNIKDVHYLDVQMNPDPDFTTCKNPNPESLDAFKLSIEKGKKVDAELLLATDPDSDRLGVLARDKNGVYQKIDGNQLGALLAYYLFSESKNLPKDACLIKTVVTSPLVEKIVKEYNAEFRDTLTGFKNVCGLIREFEKAGTPTFIMGFEESYGYSIGNHVRDKDAIVTAMLILEMAKFYKKDNKSLLDILEDIYKKYGYYKDHLIALQKPGKSGMEEIANIMSKFRNEFINLSDEKPVKIQDFKSQKEIELINGKETDINIESSNVLKYFFEDGSFIALRPSGTEPKIKFYFSTNRKTKIDAENRLNYLKSIVEKIID